MDVNEEKKSVSWQKFMDEIDPKMVINAIQAIINNYRLSSSIKTICVYTIVCITIIIAGILAFYEILEGQAIAGFLGAAIGYLLSNSSD